MSDQIPAQDAIDAGAVAAFELLADEYDCWDEDPLESGRRWQGIAKAVLNAQGDIPGALARYDEKYRTDWSSRGAA